MKRGDIVRASHEGQWYPATYVAARSSGEHRVRWEDNTVGEVSTVELIKEESKGGPKARPSGNPNPMVRPKAAGSPKAAYSPKGSAAPKHKPSEGLPPGHPFNEMKTMMDKYDHHNKAMLAADDGSPEETHHLSMMKKYSGLIKHSATIFHDERHGSN